ncbi:MAG TPA: tRNA pseudouridine(38-40) synthase TruA, partial [Blastocatellia bacterium]|nr:tRNA pseudouridine(38-40) synthase TruA [Blastocatellia bacterium]
IEYEGTRYRGWQEQKNARTVAGEIRTAAADFFNGPVELSGSGRTDAGVHALAQVAKLKSDRAAAPAELQFALNDRLPADINVVKVEESRPGFHPRHDALSRFYLYQISTRRTAFAKRYVWWVKDRLDVDRMRQASQAILGRHDFEAFCEKLEGERSTLVVVQHFEIGIDGDLILFRIGASHFLWKMVRRLVGSLVEVGRGSLSANDFKGLLRPRSASGTTFDVAAHTAPPSGLFLERVLYDKEAKAPRLRAAFPVAKQE